ncbi:MAG: chromophore lyase CpcT/CpeT, partial [Candidatus Sulfomarinibacteraceae bacterium]
PVAGDSLEVDLEVMMEWFAGEFDNHQQVVEEIEAEKPPEQPHEWIHSIFQPVELPVFGDHVFYVEQYTDGDPTKIYRNRIYSFSINEEMEAIQLTIYSFKDHEAVIGAHEDPSKLEGLTMEDVRTLPGCEVFWKKQADNFIGWMPDGACRVPSRRTGKIIVIDDDLVLTKNEIWIGDRAEDEDGNYVFGNKLGIPHKLMRSHDFTCWAVVRDGDDGEWGTVARELTLHDQGGRAFITTQEDPPRNLKLELEQRVYAGERRVEVLKIAVYEEGNDESLSYSWAAPDSTNVGMNLRWFQAGCTRE